jgi:Transposase DDE domain
VRVVLDSNEIEVLITSLLDTNLYPSDLFKDLYFRRWRIETRYDILKNALKIECFSGISQIVVEQDLYIAILIANFEAILRDESNQELKIELAHRKKSYQVNISSAINILKHKIIDLLLAENPEDVIRYLKAVFKRSIEIIRHNRSFDRDMEKLKQRKSPRQFNNRK